MTTRQILFIGGIHGVGKTTVAEKLAVELGVQRFSAGDLIRGQLRAANQDKAVLDVDKNQDVLVVAVRARVTGPAVLDGHFCLIGASLEVRPVPMRTFVELAPAGLILVTCEISEVARRLKSRDGRDYDLDLLARLQDAELLHAEKVSAALRCPILRVDADTADTIGAFARRSLSIS